MRNAKQTIGAGVGAAALVTAGIIIGLSTTNSGADGQPNPVPSVSVVSTSPDAATTIEKVAPPTPANLVAETPASTVEAVTTPQQPAPAAPEPVATSEEQQAPAPVDPAPQVTQGEGIVEGPSAEPGALVAPPAPPLIVDTAQPNGQ